MNRLQVLKSALIGGASVLALVHPAAAKIFNIPDGDLARALGAYMQQAGVQIAYSDDVVRGHRSPGAKGNYTELAALTQVLRGTGFTVQSMAANIIGIVPQQPAAAAVRVAQAARRAPAAVPMAPTIETVVVTAQHKTENIQNVPISITALSQQQLTDRQVAAGPDLVKQVPNLTFSKTNFSGYNLEIRGIGTQAISVTTDPAVAVAFNDIPFIRNHFFEQEFFDVGDLEVLRGPQGTLYGRNATAGVVNIKSALPTDQYEAMLSADIGNYSNRRLEGMLNIPIVGDTLDLRIAGEWTKRDGYSFNTLTGSPIDGRDLWSSRVTLGWKPRSDIQAYLIWEHFSEDDDRLRSSKQLCKTAPSATEVNGIPVEGHYVVDAAYDPLYYVSQGCEDTSLYSPNAFEVPNGYAVPYASALGALDFAIRTLFDPYASTTQSTNLRDIESALNPVYRAKNDTLELNISYNVTPALTFTSQTGYNNDFLYSAEDYNRFNTAPGIFVNPGYNNVGYQRDTLLPDPGGPILCGYNGTIACNPSAIFCDPQVGCSDRLVAEDLSDERAWQLSQEFRLSSNFSGPLNFSVGGNYLHYETEENYYVFVNTLTQYTTQAGTNIDTPVPEQAEWIPGVSDNSQCLKGGFVVSNPFATHDPLSLAGKDACSYIDPNPITHLNNEGHNYFLSQNPYILNSYAMFGEAYYNIANDLKLTAGARWTVDQKHFIDIPSELLTQGYGYATTGVVNQQWNQWTGRAAVNWTPQLDFTDQTLIYGSYAHGYKAGGANPPGATLLTLGSSDTGNPIHPLTFRPEFIEAFELGTKNTLPGGGLTLNGDVFYYNYTGYQISEIVDRTAINNNYNAHVEGAEFEGNWEPLPGLKFGLAQGFENTALAGGDKGIDLMDRTAGNPDWMVLKPFVTQASNCIMPTYVVAAFLNIPEYNPTTGELDDVNDFGHMCGTAYTEDLDPVTRLPYVPDPAATCLPNNTCTRNNYVPPGYPGFNPLTAPNNGEGFDKPLGGNQLPNAPHFTTSFTAEYSMPVSDDWAATLHGDFYWQSQQWARVFQDPIDKIRGYSTTNLSLILTSANGWQVMAYVKNVFDVTAVTGTFLNSDDSGLTTNVFLTDPRLYGVRVTKHLDENDGFWGSEYSGADFFTGLFSDTDNGKPPLWIELGGQLSRLDDGQETFSSPLMAARPSDLSPSQKFEKPPLFGLDETGKVSFQPEDSDWVFSAAVSYGRSSSSRNVRQEPVYPIVRHYPTGSTLQTSAARFAETDARNSEQKLILDFQAGKDVGLGMFGGTGSSIFNLGVRFAQFNSKSNVVLKSDPDWRFHYKYYDGKKIPFEGSYHSNAAAMHAARSFRGLGPSISWNASAPFAGKPNDGELTIDWGLNAAVLFGRQRARVHHQATGQYHNDKYPNYAPRVVVYQPAPVNVTRVKSVTVPNLGGFAGLSFHYANAKVSFGYRADEFFGAIDGGIDTYKSYNRGFFGPYANISIGLGG